jgi:RimJ/RimL family protein N-acetyltransferase
MYVVADNKLAIRLYEKLGFKIEGVIGDSHLGGDGIYDDELVMGLILE